eukprot:jgi/Botrbrau1/3145/Bobra.0070s0112.1
MLIASVVIPTYVLYFLYFLGVAIYLKRFILRPPQLKAGNVEDVVDYPDDASSTGDSVVKMNIQNTCEGARATPVHLEWAKVCFEAKQSGVAKKVLQDCNGMAKPGDITAIMGPSGAGKSTLIDVLAGRLKRTSGSILVNSRDRTSLLKSLSAYVPQESHFVPTFTVWETLALHAYLRLPCSSKAEHSLLISETLQSMGLLSIKESRVGGILPGGVPVKGISGGEKRRLHVCCAIVAAPSLIFLDEPTSGLDSHAALGLVSHLEGLAKRDCTIVFTVHQPNLLMWKLFDQLVLLAQGFTLYCGPPSQAEAWFRTSFGYDLKPGTCETPSDWLLNLVSINFKKTQTSRLGFQTVAELQQAAARWAEHSPLSSQLSKGGSSFGGSIGQDPVGTESLAWGGYPTTMWNQLRVLCWRAFIQYTRSPADVLRRILSNMIIGTLIGVIFKNTVGYDGGILIISFFSLIYQTIFVCLMITVTSISIFVTDKLQFITDAPSHIYGPLPWFIAQTLVSIPFYLAGALALLLVVFGLVGLNTNATALPVFLLVGCLQSLVGQQLFVFCAHATPVQDAALISSILYSFLALMLAGFFVKWQDLPRFLDWLSYATPCRYAFGALIKELLQGTVYEGFAQQFGMHWSFAANIGALLLTYATLLALTFCSLCLLKRKYSVRG